MKHDISFPINETEHLKEQGRFVLSGEILELGTTQAPPATTKFVNECRDNLLKSIRIFHVPLRANTFRTNEVILRLITAQVPPTTTKFLN